MPKYEEKGPVKCTFCGKTQDEVHRIIAGPGVYICNECVELCREIIEEDTASQPVDLSEVPKPQQIMETLNQYVIGPVSYTHLTLPTIYSV